MNPLTVITGLCRKINGENTLFDSEIQIFKLTLFKVVVAEYVEIAVIPFGLVDPDVSNVFIREHFS